MYTFCLTGQRRYRVASTVFINHKIAYYVIINYGTAFNYTLRITSENRESGWALFAKPTENDHVLETKGRNTFKTELGLGFDIRKKSKKFTLESKPSSIIFV